MIPALLAALAIGGILVVAFWDEIVDWLKKLVAGLRRMFSELKKKIAHAAGAFIERVERGLAAIRHKLYYQAKFRQTSAEKFATTRPKSPMRSKTNCNCL